MPKYRLHVERTKKIITDVYYYVDAKNKEDVIKQYENGQIKPDSEKFDTAREYERLYYLQEIKSNGELGDDLLTDEESDQCYTV